MSDAQSMVFQVIGSFVGLGFLAFISIRTRWPYLRAAVMRFGAFTTQYTPRTAAATPVRQGIDTATRRLLQDGRRWLIVGAPGSGKSTAARALVRSYLGAGADVLICDPEGSSWPRGARMVGSPDDYAAIRLALLGIMTEAGQRRAAFQRGTRVFNPLLILIDEGPQVLRSTDGAIDMVADLARRGRKLGISVILLATDTQARTLGIEGQTKLLDSFTRLDARMTPSGVELLEDGRVLSTVQLDHLADDLVLPILSESPDADRLLASALGVEAGTGSGGGFSGDSLVPTWELVPLVPTGSALVPTDTDAVPGGFDSETIRALAAAGWSRNKISAKIGGRRDDTLKMIARVLEG